MTHRTRNILFLVLFILFLITAPITVFYSLGWRFNWETKKIVQTGIFYFKIWPKSSQIYINGKLKEKTDIFFGSVLIENLLPGKYEIEIKKEQYHGWKKTLEIKKRGVSEAKNIVLIPKDPIFNILTKEVKEFYFSPDREKIILEQEDSLKLFELKKNLKSHLIDKKDISAKKVEIVDLKFSPNSERILLQINSKQDIQYYILEMDKSPVNLFELDFLYPAEEIYFHPRNPDKLFVLQDTILNEIDLSNKKILLPILEDIIAYLVNDNIYYLDSSGSIFKTDLLTERKEKLNIIPFPLKQETKYQLTVFGSNIFLQENNVLYIFNQDKKLFEKLLEPIKDYKVSSDSSKMVYFNNYEIWILFLEKQYDQPSKEAGEQLFITRFSEKINDVFWYTNHYLIFNLGEQIRIMEIDNRDKINMIDLTEFKNPKIFWADKKLYILSEENLYVSTELTP